MCKPYRPCPLFKYDVNRGLRDASGKGVMAGLTEIVEVKAYVIDDGDLIPCEGKLYYRGYEIRDLVKGFVYSMLGLPKELYTPIWANVCIVGWSAHRIEEILSNGRFIRPAYKKVTKKRLYISIKDR